MYDIHLSLLLRRAYQVSIFSFGHPFYLRTFPLSFSLPRRNSDPGSLSWLFPPPLRYTPSVFSREDSNYFPRRLASNCAYPRCYALSAVDSYEFFTVLQLHSKIQPARGIRTPEPSTVGGSI